MPHNDESPHWREDFPHLHAAWLSMQAAAQRASTQMRKSAAAPSAWTTAVLAGGLAFMLALVLLFVDPQQTASIDNRGIQPLLGVPGGSASPSTLKLEVDWLTAADDNWEEVSTALWSSTTPRTAAPAFAFVQDDWMTAAPRPEPVLASADPYYFRAETIAFEQFTKATAPEEVPTALAGPEVDRTIGVILERTPAALTESGALAYTLHVYNPDVHPVEQVRIVETLPQPDQILDTDPAALMTPDGALVWQLADLKPLEARSMTVTLAASPADAPAPIQTVAAVDVETEVSVKTQIFPLEISQLPADDLIEPELVLPDSPPESEPVAQPAFEPIDPVLADDPPAAEFTGPNPFGGEFVPDDYEPITPEFSGSAPVALPEQFDPFVPDDEPVAPVAPYPENLADEPVRPAPAPRPLPLDSAHPPQPILSVHADARKSVRTGDILTTEYAITNEGDAAADGVVLTVFIPPELRHKHGFEVEHRIPRLLPGQTHRARLLTKAAAAGTAELDAVLSAAGRPEDRQSLTVRVVGSTPTASGARSKPR